MAGELTLALRTAQSGLRTNQQALNTVADNVANANTEGYSRKVVNLEQRVLGGNGVGVQVGKLTRQIDENLVKNYRAETTELKAVEVQRSFFERTQQMFGSPADDSSLSHTLTRFSGALESLSMAPHNALDQREVVRWAEELTSQFRDMSAGIQDLRLEADQRIGETVSEVNRLVDEIAGLNADIVEENMAGRGLGDLEDQRDVALDKLSGLVDSHVFKGEGGVVSVFTTSGRILVGSNGTDLTHKAASAASATVTHAEGEFSGIYAGGALSANDITNEIKGGELKGLIELRDSILPDMQSTLDELAGGLRDTVNQIHNRGVAFPGRQEMTGTRTFVDATTQSMSLTGDVRMVLLDDAGNEVRAGTIPSGTTDTIGNVAGAIDAFLAADGGSASIDSDGRLSIDAGTSGLHLAFRDEVGGAPADATIAFDADGDGASDETVQGFSSFFGLNDFFVDGGTDAVFESDVLAKSTPVPAADLTFRNAGGMNFTVPIGTADSSTLGAVVAKINDSAPDGTVSASLVPDGAGMRLRLMSDDGESMTVTASDPAVLAKLGMHSADTGVAGSLRVREDIVARPALVASAAVQQGTGGRYFASAGDNTVTAKLAAAFTDAQGFDAAGSLGAMSVTFSRYASDILSDNASLATSNENAVTFKQSLATNLKAQSDDIRGVNLDQEMSDLILYEQGYAASARIISVVQDMFDALDRAVQ